MQLENYNLFNDLVFNKFNPFDKATAAVALIVPQIQGSSLPLSGQFIAPSTEVELCLLGSLQIYYRSRIQKMLLECLSVNNL